MLLKLLFSHYRRHPLQALFLLVGIILANALLVGVLVINAQARASYAASEREFGIQPIAYLRPATPGSPLLQQAYIQLRRQGFDTLVPLLQHWLLLPDGRRLPATGIDPVAASGLNINNTDISDGLNLSRWLLPPGQTWVAQARARQLGWQSGQQPPTASGKRLPPLVISQQMALGHRILMDLGYLQQLADRPGELSEIAVLPLSEHKLKQLKQALPASLKFATVRPVIETTQMTDSFHLNLTAMGLLCLVVGGFLIYNAITFSFTDRHQLFIKLRLAGVTRNQLRNAIILELSLFTLLGLSIGYLLGFMLAGLLLPGLGQTLSELYGVYISYPDSLLGNLSLLPLAMTILVVTLCAWLPLRQQLLAPLLPQQQSHWLLEKNQRRDRQLLRAGLLLLLLCFGMCQLPLSLLAAFACMAALLLGVALITPWLLRQFLHLLSRLLPEQAALAQWVVADSRWLLGPAAIAIMAMVLVLVSNSGLNTLIFSFRSATIEWLDQRLAAPLYLRPQQQTQQIQSWLQQHYPQISLYPRFSLRHHTPQGYVEIVSQPEAEQTEQNLLLLEQLRNARSRFAAGDGVLISERAWLKSGVTLGQTLPLCPQRPAVTVVGIYRDYGNPLDQWMVAPTLFKRCFPATQPQGWALHSQHALDWQALQLRLATEFELQQTQLINQTQIRKLVLSIFEQTFSVAQALNGLTLLVAAIGIFCATSAIHHHRLKQQALLAVMGVARGQRLMLLFIQWGMIGLLILLLVWPFGQALAWLLTAIVTPAAFGWRFPAQLYLQHYSALAAITFSALFLATLWPAIRLARANLIAQLKAENG